MVGSSIIIDFHRSWKCESDLRSGRGIDRSTYSLALSLLLFREDIGFINVIVGYFPFGKTVAGMLPMV